MDREPGQAAGWSNPSIGAPVWGEVPNDSFQRFTYYLIIGDGDGWTPRRCER